MNRSVSRLLPLLAILVFVGCAGVADRVSRGVERGAERAAERETSRAADRAVTGAIRSAENAVVCVVTDSECIERARANGRTVEVRDRNGNVVETHPAPGSDVDVNNAVTAGERTLVHLDYVGTPVGDFPSGLEFLSGSWEVASWNGQRLLRTTGPRGAAFLVVLPEELPDSFTVETEVYLPRSNHRLVVLTQPHGGSWGTVDYNVFQLAGDGNGGAGVQADLNAGLSTSMNPAPALHDGLTRVRIRVEGDYAKVYVGGDRVANLPNAYLPRSEALMFEVATGGADEEAPIYIGPIRVAAIETD